MIKCTIFKLFDVIAKLITAGVLYFLLITSNSNYFNMCFFFLENKVDTKCKNITEFIINAKNKYSVPLLFDMDLVCSNSTYYMELICYICHFRKHPVFDPFIQIMEFKRKYLKRKFRGNL